MSAIGRRSHLSVDPRMIALVENFWVQIDRLAVGFRRFFPRFLGEIGSPEIAVVGRAGRFQVDGLLVLLNSRAVFPRRVLRDAKVVVCGRVTGVDAEGALKIRTGDAIALLEQLTDAAFVVTALSGLLDKAAR